MDRDIIKSEKIAIFDTVDGKFENIEEKFRKLGAKIERVEE